MTELKFRAWDEIRGKMLPIRQVVIPDGSNECGRQELAVSGLKFGTNPSSFLIAPPLMQYTGLKDKNGAEIYEGDVVKACVNRLTDNAGITSLIRWNDSQARFDGLDKESMSDGLLEVIGNIYENPELVIEPVKEA